MFARATVPNDGVYLVCGVPMGVPVTVQATFLDQAGREETVELDEAAYKHDLVVSIASPQEAREPPLFIGAGVEGFWPDLGVPLLVRCISIDRCNYLGVERIRARKRGDIDSSRPTIEEFVAAARRAGVHAVIDIKLEWSPSIASTVTTLLRIEGEGVRFTAEICKSWVEGPIGSVSLAH